MPPPSAAEIRAEIVELRRALMQVWLSERFDAARAMTLQAELKRLNADLRKKENGE